jgi:hypothetical protein
VFELVDADVRGEVVDAVQRLAQREGVRLGRRDAHQQRARQPRPGRHGDAVEVAGRDPGVLQGALDGGDHRLQVRAAGDLRHHPAVTGVVVDAGGDGVGQQGVPPDDADSGLVAGGLDPEDERLVTHRFFVSLSFS